MNQADSTFNIVTNALKFPLTAENNNNGHQVVLPHWRCTDGVVTPSYFCFFIPMEAFSSNATKFGDFDHSYLGKHYYQLMSFFLDTFSNPMCGSPKHVMIQPDASCGPIDKFHFEKGWYLPEALLQRTPGAPAPPAEENNNNNNNNDNDSSDDEDENDEMNDEDNAGGDAPPPQNPPANQAMKDFKIKKILETICKKISSNYSNTFCSVDHTWKEKISIYVETVIKGRYTNTINDICQENIAGIRFVIVVNDMRMSVNEAIEKQLEDNRSYHHGRFAVNMFDKNSRGKSDRQALLRKQVNQETVRMDDIAHTDMLTSASSLYKTLKVTHPGWYMNDETNTMPDDVTKISGNWVRPLIKENYSCMVMTAHGACAEQCRSIFTVNQNHTISMNFALPHLVVKCSLSEFNNEIFTQKMFPFLAIRFNNPYTYSLTNNLALTIQSVRNRATTLEERIKENFSIYSSGELRNLATSTKYDRSCFHVLADQSKPYMDKIYLEATGPTRNDEGVIKRWRNVHHFFWDYFKRYVDTQSYVSDAMRHVIMYYKEKFVNKKSVICRERNHVASNLSHTGSWQVSRVMQLDCSHQILSAHNYILFMNDCAMLSWVRLPMHNHVFASGGPNESKSFASKIATGKFLIPGTWRIEVGSSNMSLFNETGIANSQTTINLEEMGDIFFKSLKHLDKEQSRQRQMIQALMTDDDVSFRRATWRKNPLDPKNSIGSVETIYPYYQGTMVGTSNRPVFAPEMADRSILLLTSENLRNLEGRDSHSFINHKPSVTELMNIAIVETEYRDQQMLCALIFAAIENRLLPEIPMEMFNIYYDMTINFLYKHNLVSKLSDRVGIQARNLYYVVTVLKAVNIVFRSEISPFRGKMKPKRDNDGNIYPEFDFKHFELDDLKAVGPYLAPDEELVFSSIIRIVSNHVREIDYLVVQSTAINTCKFNVNDIRDYVRQYGYNRCAFNLCGQHNEPGEYQPCKVNSNFMHYMSSERTLPPLERIDALHNDTENVMYAFGSWSNRTVRIGDQEYKYNDMLKTRDSIGMSPMLPLYDTIPQINKFLVREIQNDLGNKIQVLDINYIVLEGKTEADIISTIVRSINIADSSKKANILKNVSEDSVSGCVSRLKNVMWTGPYIEFLHDRFALTYSELAKYLHPSYLSTRERVNKPIIEVVSRERNHHSIAINIHVFFRETGKWADDLLHALCHKYTRERDVVVAGVPYEGYPQLYRVVHLEPRDVVPTISNSMYRPSKQTDVIFNHSVSKRARVSESGVARAVLDRIEEDENDMEVETLMHEKMKALSLVATTSSQKKLVFDFDLEAKFTTDFNIANRYDRIEAGRLNHAEIIDRRINRLYGKNNDSIHPNDDVLNEYLSDPYTTACYKMLGEEEPVIYPRDFVSNNTREQTGPVIDDGDDDNDVLDTGRGSSSNSGSSSNRGSSSSSFTYVESNIDDMFDDFEI